MSAHDAGGADVAAARAAVERDPGRPAPLFRLCCLHLERTDPAANALLPELERFPAYAPGWQAVGETLLATQPAAALVAFTRAFAAAGRPQAALGRAAALTALDRHRDAASVLSEMRASEPADGRLAFQHGVALRSAGEFAAARAALERAAALEPKAAALQALGVVCQDLGDHAAAVPAFRAALAASPRLHEAAFNLGVALQETGALDAAIGAYAQAWRLRPDVLGRIAQALASPRVGRLWLRPDDLIRALAARA